MKIEKAEKIGANFYDEIEYFIHIRNLKQSLSHGLVLKKFHRVIKFYQSAWLKPFIGMNIDSRKTVKTDFEKIFLNCWIMQFLEKQ